MKYGIWLDSMLSLKPDIAPCGIEALNMPVENRIPRRVVGAGRRSEGEEEDDLSQLLLGDEVHAWGREDNTRIVRLGNRQFEQFGQYSLVSRGFSPNQQIARGSNVFERVNRPQERPDGLDLGGLQSDAAHKLGCW